MKKLMGFAIVLLGAIFLFCLSNVFNPPQPSLAQSLNPGTPSEPVKLIFIHHSCGENWLTDGNGDLGLALGRNNYFVSDTNYGWGPDSIGDATDYYNWYDWFVGPDSSRYLNALYNESGQNSSYTRPIDDPGGENRIIMFKSCFPNSDLSGRPDDPPADGEQFTVGHAKYIYNQLLSYFVTRPDKLFIAITPPPLIDPTHAENAREFSRWLVEDWLRENNYPLNNVAVWDFHNILTHPDNHHRFQNGSIEYIIQNGNGSLYYDSDGDDHPNRTGNQKATTEFVPMLNVFYNRWAAEAGTYIPPEEAPPQVEEEPSGGETPPEPSAGGFTGGMIDDFEGNPPPGTSGWEYYAAEGTQSTLTCGVDSSMAKSGTSSLRIDFYVDANAWATCPLFYYEPPDFRNTQGVAFDYHASAAGLLFNMDVSGGTPDARTSYGFTVETVPESVNGWVHVELTWDQIVGAEWEAYSGVPINPAEINGFIFGFSTLPDTTNSGTLWIDNLSVIGGDTPSTGGEEVAPAPEEAQEEVAAPPSGGEEEQVGEPEEPQPTEETGGEEGGRRLCPGSTAMMALTLFAAVYAQKKYAGRGRDR